MTRRVLAIAGLTAALATSLAAPAAGTSDVSRGIDEPAGTGGSSFQPDGWIKLCGQNLGCTIDPLPHPWRGKNVYNTDGRNQTETDDINEGEGIRYWIAIENDGTASDTFGVRGCRGNRTFEVNKVLLGKHTRQDPSAEDLTSRFKQGTLTFDIDAGKKVVFTLNIITHDTKNVTYRCEIEAHSANDQDSRDMVVAEMTTF